MPETTDWAAWLRENAPLGPLGRRMADAAAEIDRLRRFVQFVADHSNDPGVVREARAHGAR